MRRRVSGGGVFIAALSVLAACLDTADEATARQQPDAPAMSSLTLSIHDDTLVVADSVTAGWARVRLQPTSDRHIPVLFRLNTATSDMDMPVFIAALDTMVATPSQAVAIGGPEMGSAGEVILDLTPGRYVVACVRRGEDGHRHLHSGEYAVLDIRGSAGTDAVSSRAPVSPYTLQLADFAFVGEPQWKAGATVIRLENTGAQDHQVRLARLDSGVTVAQWMESEDPNSVSTTVAGLARLGAGQSAYLPLELQPGTYVAYCLIADPASKKPHVELGMFREISVR